MDKKEHLKHYGFGGPAGANPSEAGKLGRLAFMQKKEEHDSFRAGVRRLAALEIDPNVDKPFRSRFKGKKCYGADLIAAAAMDGAAAGDARLIEYVTEQRDGKVLQPTMNTDLAAVMAMSEEEMDEFNRRFNAQAGVNAGEHAPDENGASEGNGETSVTDASAGSGEIQAGAVHTDGVSNC